MREYGSCVYKALARWTRESSMNALGCAIRRRSLGATSSAVAAAPGLAAPGCPEGIVNSSKLLDYFVKIPWSG